MNPFVRQILLSRPVLIGGAVLVGAREFLALNAPLRRDRRLTRRTAVRVAADRPAA